MDSNQISCHNQIQLLEALKVHHIVHQVVLVFAQNAISLTRRNVVGTFLCLEFFRTVEKFLVKLLPSSMFSPPVRKF